MAKNRGGSKVLLCFHAIKLTYQVVGVWILAEVQESQPRATLVLVPCPQGVRTGTMEKTPGHLETGILFDG